MHQPFLDWYDIWAGQACANENGESWLKDPPLGVRLAVQQVRRSPVFFRAEKPWEQARMAYPYVLLDDGFYRMWFWTSGELHRGGRSGPSSRQRGAGSNGSIRCHCPSVRSVAYCILGVPIIQAFLFRFCRET